VQAWPQVPQFCLSLVVSTHEAPHWVLGGRQATAVQTLLWQVSLVEHLWAQVPQLLASVEVLTQLPEHSCIGSGPHDGTQVLAWQTPDGQTLPQVPQLAGLVLVSTHLPPQRVSGAQLVVQAPPWQTWAELQAWPQ
jgi:hypothetical protein